MQITLANNSVIDYLSTIMLTIGELNFDGLDELEVPLGLPKVLRLCEFGEDPVVMSKPDLTGVCETVYEEVWDILMLFPFGQCFDIDLFSEIPNPIKVKTVLGKLGRSGVIFKLFDGVFTKARSYKNGSMIPSLDQLVSSVELMDGNMTSDTMVGLRSTVTKMGVDTVPVYLTTGRTRTLNIGSSKVFLATM